MRKLLFILTVSIAMVACTSPFGELEGIAHIPGVEPGKGEYNYNENTTYKGALLPNASIGGGREDMINLLKLLGTQKGEIDDALFVEQLNTKLFDPELRFQYCEYEDKPAVWVDMGSTNGGRPFYTLWMHEDGWYTYQEFFLSATNENYQICEFIRNELGIIGWVSSQYYWEYDAESNTLYTSDPEKEPTYAAEVLYFDGECAILEGFVYPMADGFAPKTPMGLFSFKFKDGKENFYDTCVNSLDEYNKLIEQYRDK